MADGRSFAEEAAATDLCDDSRVPRERHKKRVEHLATGVVSINQVQRNGDLQNCEQEMTRCDYISDSASACASDSRNSLVDKKNVSRELISDEDDCDDDDDDDDDEEDDDDDEDDDELIKCKTNKSQVLVSTDANHEILATFNDNIDRDLTTVVDAAAAAVAVSAIPAAVKDIQQKSTLKNDANVVTRLAAPFKGQIRTAEDTLVGPCGKKRCADRYDSSESSDSGVAVSCGECSSSGTSDITEPGSPCSTSSDEGVAIRGTAPSPLPSLPKLAPSTPPVPNGTRPQWPWTPPLAATACSTYKQINGEPEVGTLPKAGAADPTARSGKLSGKLQAHHHESQGKITEYFKTQIKPQLPKVKKPEMLVAKSSPEFRRPPTVQRNKGGLAKYLGGTTPNERSNHDWEVRTIAISPPPLKKLTIPSTPRVTVTKLDKILVGTTALPGLPIPSEVLSSIPPFKISSLRLTSEASPKASGTSPPPTPTPTTEIFDKPAVKPIVNENNNITNPTTQLNSNWMPEHIDLQRKETPAPREDDDDDEDEEEDSSRSSESKPSSSPILSAPTTIRFPARAPAKNGTRATDSGVCRWDKCDADFECSGALLEHLQAAHINSQTGENFVCHWQGCKVQGRASCSRRWLERHVLFHGGNKPFRCIVDGCGSRFSSQIALERHVNNHFNQPETSNSSTKRSCENGGKLVRRNGKKLRYRRQPWSARVFDYFDTGIMEGLQHRLLELATTRTQGYLADTPGNSMIVTSQVIAKRVEMDGKTKVLLRWHPEDITPDEWVPESEVQRIKHVDIRKAASVSTDEVSLVLYPAMHGGTPPTARTKQRRKPVKNS